MSERSDLLASIVNTINDYRMGEIAPPVAAHVDRWVKQFADDVQVPLLREMDHVLKSTYFSLDRVTAFLRGLIDTKKLVGDDSCAFWSSVNFLDIQQGGNSQTEMLALFDALLKEKCGLTIAECANDSTVYIYLDDAVFTGNRVRRDIEAWVENEAPAEASLHIVSIAHHSGGQYYASGKINQAISAAGKKLNVKWWRAIELEDRRTYSQTSDVLRPTSIPNDAAVQDYVNGMTYKPTLRSPGNVGKNSFFSSEAGRNLLEQEFLVAGARIRQLCPNLGNTQRPLGHSTLETLGFGSPIVTFRNCPNNAPLALWVGDP